MFNGSQVRKLREERNYSLSFLANQAGISTSYLSEIERGCKSPSLKTIEKISRVLNVSSREFVQPPDRAKKPHVKTSNSSLGEKFSRVRQEYGLSQAQLARKAGLSPGLIGQLEQGKVQPSLQTVEKVSEALEISPCFFVSDDDELQQLLYLMTPEMRSLLMEPQVLSALRILCQCNTKEFSLVLDFIKLLKQHNLSD